MANHFVHERAICESEQVGAGTRIWAFAHILPGAKNWFQLQYLRLGFH